jgi:hypothetical protein
MSSLSEIVTELALNPFAAARTSGTITVGGRAFALSELRATLDAPPLAGEVSWSSCETCSDPGGDFDPWPKAT